MIIIIMNDKSKQLTRRGIVFINTSGTHAEATNHLGCVCRIGFCGFGWRWQLHGLDCMVLGTIGVLSFC